MISIKNMFQRSRSFNILQSIASIDDVNLLKGEDKKKITRFYKSILINLHGLSVVEIFTRMEGDKSILIAQDKLKSNILSSFPSIKSIYEFSEENINQLNISNEFKQSQILSSSSERKVQQFKKLMKEEISSIKEYSADQQLDSCFPLNVFDYSQVLSYSSQNSCPNAVINREININNLKNKNKKQITQEKYLSQQVSLNGVNIKIILSSLESLDKDILVVPFTLDNLKQPLLLYLKKVIGFDIKDLLDRVDSYNGEIISLSNTQRNLKYAGFYLAKLQTKNKGYKQIIKSVDEMVANIFQKSLQFGDKKIIIPGIRLKRISHKQYFFALLQSIIDYIVFSSMAGYQIILKEICYCTNKPEIYIEEVPWFKNICQKNCIISIINQCDNDLLL